MRRPPRAPLHDLHEYAFTRAHWKHAPQAELWLGETGNAQCGGEPGVSHRFASSLWYLDQLGALGRLGQPMIRQTLVGSHYGLLDPDTLAPRPDYWADGELMQGIHMIATGESNNVGIDDTVASFGAWLSYQWFFAPHADVRVDNVFYRLRTQAQSSDAFALLAQLHVYS